MRGGARRRGAPRGAGCGSGRGTGSGQAAPESRGPETLSGGRADDRPPGVGAGLGGPGRPVRGHGEVKGISARAPEPAFGGALARAGAGGGWRRAGGKLGQLERRPRGRGPGPVEAPRAAGLWEAASGGSAAAADKGLRGGRAGFPSWDPEARRPLPTASPASGAGAGLARHLLHIDAAAASRASPAPGMQWQRRAGPRLRGGGRDRGRLSPPRRSFPGGAPRRDPGAARAVGSLGLRSLPPPRPARGVACPVAQSPILVPPFPPGWTGTNRSASLGLSRPLSNAVGGGTPLVEWRRGDCDYVSPRFLGRTAFLGTPHPGTGPFLPLPVQGSHQGLRVRRTGRGGHTLNQ